MVQETDPLVVELARELQQPKKYGWPLIIETRIPRSHSRSVAVIWDKWHPYTDEFRIETVLRAIEKYAGDDALASIGSVEALTIPEAREAGLLPVKIFVRIPPDSQVEPALCRQAMIDCGASTLENNAHPELRFPNEEMAEACRQQLLQDVPGSDPVWMFAYDGPVPLKASFLLSRN